MADSQEVVLAQEEAVIRRGTGARKEVEAAFGMGGETEGTLVLTNRRLVYVHGNESEVDLDVGAFSKKRLFFPDVEDLRSAVMDSSSLDVPLQNITNVTGRKEPGVAPKLQVKFTDHGVARASEFVQQLTGRSRRKNLSDWAAVITKLKAGKVKVVPLPATPDPDSLQGRILAVLGDMQEKGLFSIETEVENRYKADLDPDQVEQACNSLADSGLIKNVSPPKEDPFYRKISPLGEDDLGA